MDWTKLGNRYLGRVWNLATIILAGNQFSLALNTNTWLVGLSLGVNSAAAGTGLNNVLMQMTLPDGTNYWDAQIIASSIFGEFGDRDFVFPIPIRQTQGDRINFNLAAILAPTGQATLVFHCCVQDPNFPSIQSLFI